MTDACPDCHEGTLTTYKSRSNTAETIQRFRRCSCCEYREVATLRPATVISVRRISEIVPEMDSTPHTEDNSRGK
jgi:hypothetical protein